MILSILFREIRECLKLDPDHKDCFPFYKKVKKLVKQMQSVQNFINEKKWEDCITKANAMLKTESEVFQFIHRAKGHICHCQSKVSHYNRINVCHALTIEWQLSEKF